MLKIAIVGAGVMGKVHADAFSLIKDISIVAVVDSDLERARVLANSFGAKAYSEIAPVAADPDIRVVSVCSPTRRHCEQTLAMAQSGKHILCEKPMAWTLEEADAMIRAAKQNHVHLMIAHVLRFWPEYVAVKRLISSGELGRPLAVYAARQGPPAWWSRNDWMQDPSLSGGAVLDLLVHDTDYCNWLLGRPEKIVGAQGLRSERGAWNHVQALLSYTGAVGSFEISSALPKGAPSLWVLRVVCERGTVDYRHISDSISTTIPLPEWCRSTFSVIRPDKPPEQLAIEEGDAFYNEIAYFVECVQKGKSPEIITPADARDALEVALKVSLTLDSGAPAGLSWTTAKEKV